MRDELPLSAGASEQCEKKNQKSFEINGGVIMARIEDIERMSLEELEERSSACPSASEEVKAALEQSLAVFSEAERLGTLGRERRRTLKFAASVCAALALSLAAVFVLRPAGPKDSFSSPEEAYAELQRTLNYMGGKMDKGLSMAKDGGEKVGKPLDIMETIMNK